MTRITGVIFGANVYYRNHVMVMAVNKLQLFVSWQRLPSFLAGLECGNDATGLPIALLAAIENEPTRRR